MPSILLRERHARSNQFCFVIFVRVDLQNRFSKLLLFRQKTFRLWCTSSNTAVCEGLLPVYHSWMFSSTRPLSSCVASLGLCCQARRCHLKWSPATFGSNLGVQGCPVLLPKLTQSFCSWYMRHRFGMPAATNRKVSKVSRRRCRRWRQQSRLSMIMKIIWMLSSSKSIWKRTPSL